MASRTCLECKHWEWYAADPGYSEMTPGSDASMYCIKSYWSLKMYDDDRGDVRHKLNTAERCPEFTPEHAPTQDTQ